MRDVATTTAIATVLSALITGLIGYVIQRTSARASTANTLISSRTDIEREAFERAKSFYTDVIDRQQQEITELESDVASLKAAQKLLEVDLRACRDECRMARQELAEARGRLPIFPKEEP